MKKVLQTIALLAGLLLLPQLSVSAYACSCGDTGEVSSALAGSTAVFSGQVVAGDMFTARVRVYQVWKGEERGEVVMLTGAKDLGNKTVSINSCDYNYEVGQTYVIYSSGSGNQLIVQGCSRTAVKTDDEVKVLDAVVPHRQIGDEIRACSTTQAGTPSPAGIRLTIQTSKSTPLAAVRTSVEGSSSGSVNALTDREGRADFSALQPGQYKVTVSSDGYLAKQSFITIPASGCAEVALHLVQAQQK